MTTVVGEHTISFNLISDQYSRAVFEAFMPDGVRLSRLNINRDCKEEFVLDIKKYVEEKLRK